MLKTAYELGVKLAMQEAGLVKEAGVAGKISGGLARLGGGMQDFVTDPRVWGAAGIGGAGYGAAKGIGALAGGVDDTKKKQQALMLAALLGAGGAGIGAGAGAMGDVGAGKGALIGGAGGAGLGALLPYLK